MRTNPICKKCGVELTDENWYQSDRSHPRYICKRCKSEQTKAQRAKNPERFKVSHEKSNRRLGIRSYKENKDCTHFLGVYIAEEALCQAFKNVKRMPFRNPGYDVICNNGLKIDIKSSCKRSTGAWSFHIERNIIADYFLCLAFDNRQDLTPMHLWLLPGGVVGHLVTATIRESTIQKWNEYELDISKVSKYCDIYRGR